MLKRDYYFILVILYFILSFVALEFAIIGFICLLYPVLTFYFKGSKKWCKTYCPRKSIFVNLTSKFNIGLKAPRSLVGLKARKVVFNYFLINLFIVLMSTFMVANGNMIPMLTTRFLIVFKLFEVSPLLRFTSNPAIIHLSYRLLSMILTTFIIGVGYSILFKPRSWCAVCPITTIVSTKK